jgi:hypothetical protein
MLVLNTLDVSVPKENYKNQKLIIRFPISGFSIIKVEGWSANYPLSCTMLEKLKARGKKSKK